MRHKAQKGRRKMDERKIDHFLVLADQLSFSRAAEMLNITQPTLSRSIQSMELDLGFSLFDRTTNKMRLTPAGVFLVDELRDLKYRYSAAIKQAVSLQSGYSGQIRMGVTIGQSLFGFNKLLTDYQEMHPDVKIFLISENLSNLRTRLKNRSLDFAIGLLGDFSFISSFSYKVVGSVPLGIVVSKDHRLADQDEGSLRLTDFKDDTFILVPESETPSVRDFIRWCCKAGFWPRVAEVPDLLSVILWIEAGYGVAALSEASISYGNPALRFLYPPDLEKPDLALIWSNEDDKPVKRAFIDYLQCGIHVD